MKRLFHAAFVIARRDFTATVLSKTFIFFLIGPLLPLFIGGTFVGISSSAERAQRRPVVAVLASQPQFDALAQARQRLVDAVGDAPVIERFEPEPGRAAQQQRLLASTEPPVIAVLALDEGHPTLTGAVTAVESTSKSLGYLLEQAHANRSRPAPPIRVIETGISSGKVAADRSQTAHAGQTLLFFLTLLLATMLLSQVIEEKSNKIIEVIAAAVPIDAMFLGKLFAMLAASIIGLIVWISVGALAFGSLAPKGLSSLPEPAVGWPAFMALGVLYFAMNYLILGALFLGIGAQASSPREVQTMSLPVTMLQVIIFALASASIGQGSGPIALVAAAFPLSSPMVMLGRAAEQPEIWPHLLALAWQTLWVAVMLKLGARFFRTRVLRSGPSRGLFRRSART
ncbi:MAG: ABC transporter permease [Sphingomicrobium sp.]